MSIPVWCSRSEIFSEFSLEEQRRFFGLTEKKFIPEIDNFYYTVFVQEKMVSGQAELFVDSPEVEILVQDLQLLADNFDYKNPDRVDFHGFDFFPFGLKGYSYRLSFPECFDVLIRAKLPNERTPRIWVQLRARYIWLYGAEKCICDSFDTLKKLLDEYGIIIKQVQENRVDYAFHTNAIQNPEKFFDRPKLMKHCKTRSKIYNIVGNPQNNWSVDYCSVGSRKSNSVFFRVYNKGREVVEQNYKSFFIQKWFEAGLINSYDKYCFEVAFDLKSFDIGLLIGQIKWYLNFGKDELRKNQLNELYTKYFVENSNSNKIKDGIKSIVYKQFVTDVDVMSVRSFVSNVLPPVTNIINIEYETHRDFYRSFDNSLLYVMNNREGLLARVLQIYDCRKSFINYLTTYGNTVSFVKDNKLALKEFDSSMYLSFWKRLRSANWKTDYQPELSRTYERNLDIERMKRRILSDVAVLSIHKNGLNENGIMEDLCDALGTLNDNDMHNIGFVTTDGELVDINSRDYGDLKIRKNRQYRSIISTNLSD